MSVTVPVSPPSTRVSPAPRKSALSQPRRRLVELMQELNFGRLENLRVVDGEPVLDSQVRVVQELKFGGENGARPERETHDFALKLQYCELFATLDRLQHAQIEVLEIKHGLPFRMLIRTSVT